MLDGMGREIDYLRVSVTDRCDLRCVYCMPEAGVAPLGHETILRYEDILRLARLFAQLGVRKIRLTGGEPLTRLGLSELVRGLKAVPGLETVVLTTNAMQLARQLPALTAAGLDGVNISLDSLDETVFRAITRRSGVAAVLGGIEAACAVPGLSVKLNCVPTRQNEGELAALAAYAGAREIPLRFIELMPIGEGRGREGLSEAQVRARLGPMTPDAGGARDKCRYFRLESGARVGFISAVSHKFCSFCDRIRLTADGKLKTCLQYDAGADLAPLLAESDEVIRAAIAAAIEAKPAGHHFGEAPAKNDETRRMSQIGG